MKSRVMQILNELLEAAPASSKKSVLQAMQRVEALDWCASLDLVIEERDYYKQMNAWLLAKLENHRAEKVN